MKPITREWAEKAEGDFKVAESLSRLDEPVYDAVCFHAQQCVEKYLKAYLTEQDIPYPRTHDLEALAKLSAPSLPRLSALMDGLRFLTSFAVEIRYPGVTAQRRDAIRCWEPVVEVRKLIRERLGIGC